MEILHSFLVFFLLFSSIFVLISQNPVHSVLFLILAFCNAATILFVFNVEFLGLSFIIIYVGAIAVLFLFVVMMLNVKTYMTSTYNIYIIFLNLIAFFLLIYFLLKNCFSIWNFDEFYTAFFFDNLTNIDLLGQVLYNYYLICFLIAGFVLLIAIIGPVVLTFNFNTKNLSVLRQLSRSDNFLSFFK